jgi:VWFA-related protein
MKAKLRATAAVVLCFSFTLSFAQQPTSTPSVEPQPQQKPATPQPSPAPSPTPEPPDDLDVVKITTNLVQIDAIVTDKKGNRVIDLRPDEVEMLEDGKSQKITNFSYIDTGIEKVKQPPINKKVDPLAPPTPNTMPRHEDIKRTIALVVDDIRLSFESAYYVRRALKKFVDEQVQPDDLVAIIRTGGGIGTLQQFTTDRRMLYAAVDKVKWNPRGLGRISAVPPINSGPNLGPPEEEDDKSEVDIDEFRDDMFTSGTLGSISYVVKGLGELPGRKSLVLFSDGISMFTRDSMVNFRIQQALQKLIDQANRSAVVIYSMDARGLQTLGFTAADSSNGSLQQLQEQLSARRADFHDSQQGLEYLARSTGGFTIKNSNDLNGGIKKVMEDQQGYYLIGYRPDDTFDTNNGRFKYHDIKLKIKRPGDYRVRMRNGFYGITDEKRAAITQTPLQQIRTALASPFGASGVQLKLTSMFGNIESGSFVHSFLHVKASDLTFTAEPDGSHKATLDIIAISYGDNGVVTDQMGVTRQITVTEKQFKDFLASGFVYNIRLPIKKSGGYQLRVAVRDRTSTKIGSASQFIEVPDIKKDRILMSGLMLRAVPMSTYLKNNATAQAVDNSVEQLDPNSNPAVRQFRTGQALVYAFDVYNAKLDKVTKKPQLKTQVRIFRNGEQVFIGNELPFDPEGQKDLKRLTLGGAIQLGTSMIPGEYIIQLVVTDMLRSEKKRISSQWMSFDIANGS